MAYNKPAFTRRLRTAARTLLPARPDPIRMFYDLPYDERVRLVKESYSHVSKRKYLGEGYGSDLEQIRTGLQKNFRPYFDVIMAYARELSPNSIMQLGAYAMVEGTWLVLGGYKGRFVATDYDPEHLQYLRQTFSNTAFSHIDFRVLDLERPLAADFADVEMVVALAVLSVIQPEGMERFFAALSASKVRCLIVGDTYVKRSLGIDPAQANVSHPLTSVRNWCHSYMALAAKHGFQSFFLPDFTYSSYLEARGIFIIYRDIDIARHEAAMASAMREYIGRQSHIWPAYVAETYSGLEKAD